MMCADVGSLRDEIARLEEAGSDVFHVDIMDGRFVPNFGMGLQDTEYIVKTARIPVDVHLMVEEPGDCAERFARMGVDIVYIHAEADRHLARTLMRIADAGASPGIAINPGTAVETIGPVLPLVKYVLVMTVNPGFAGQSYLPFVERKIEKLTALRGEYGFTIVADGACSPSRIRALSAMGVEGFVLGTSALFGKGRPYAELIAALRQDEPSG